MNLPPFQTDVPVKNLEKTLYIIIIISIIMQIQYIHLLLFQSQNCTKPYVSKLYEAYVSKFQFLLLNVLARMIRTGVPRATI